MTFQNDPIRKITFEDQFPFLLVPDEMLSEVIFRCQEGPRLLLALDSFFPPDLISYLEQVLEINRLLPPLSGFPIHSSDCGMYHSGSIQSGSCANNILPLLLTQLGGLRIDRCLWFSHLDYRQTTDRESFLHADYTSEAREIGREGGTFLYHPYNDRGLGMTFRTHLERIS